jgi:hypothetical protein
MSNDASDPAKSSLVFAIITVVPAWVFIAAAFYEKPELLTWLQRAIQRSTGALAIVFRPHGFAKCICLPRDRRLHLALNHFDSRFASRDTALRALEGAEHLAPVALTFRI